MGHAVVSRASPRNLTADTQGCLQPRAQNASQDILRRVKGILRVFCRYATACNDFVARTGNVSGYDSGRYISSVEGLFSFAGQDCPESFAYGSGVDSDPDAIRIATPTTCPTTSASSGKLTVWVFTGDTGWGINVSFPASSSHQASLYPSRISTKYMGLSYSFCQPS